MMDVVIDQGNTSCKVAFFGTSPEPEEVLVLPKLTQRILKELLDSRKPDAGILSTVKELDREIPELLQKSVPHFLLLNAETPLPIRNAYATPVTLGRDRLAAAVGAWSLQPGKPLLVIDMGTAITYDFVSEEGVFIGGNIAPGLQTRLKSLHHYTDRLPLVTPDADFHPMGFNTETAICSGVMQGIVYEVQGYIRDLKAVYPSLFAFLTGGDLIYFDGKLKNGIFVSKNLVLTGLDRILRYNVQS
jgi:type III pantothenate kinase